MTTSTLLLLWSTTGFATYFVCLNMLTREQRAHVLASIGRTIAGAVTSCVMGPILPILYLGLVGYAWYIRWRQRRLMVQQIMGSLDGLISSMQKQADETKDDTSAPVDKP